MTQASGIHWRQSSFSDIFVPRGLNIRMTCEQKPSKVQKPCDIVYNKTDLMVSHGLMVGLLIPKFLVLPSSSLTNKYPEHSFLSLVYQVQFPVLPRIIP
jgi:hypothetical protein